MHSKVAKITKKRKKLSMFWGYHSRYLVTCQPLLTTFLKITVSWPYSLLALGICNVESQGQWGPVSIWIPMTVFALVEFGIRLCYMYPSQPYIFVPQLSYISFSYYRSLMLESPVSWVCQPKYKHYNDNVYKIQQCRR